MALPKKWVYSIPLSPQDEAKPATDGRFRFTDNLSVMSVSQLYVHFRPPKIKKTKARWYVEYWYKIPPELREQYNNKVFKRFIVIEDINRYKTDEYAQLLCDMVLLQLKRGYNPFEEEKKVLVSPPLESVAISLNVGLDRFLESAKDKGLRRKSIYAYSAVAGLLKEFFLTGNKIYQPIEKFTKKDISEFLLDLNRKNKHTSTTYNNLLRVTRVIFNWFVKEEYISKSPALGVEFRPTHVTKHKYYDDKTAALLKAVLKRDRPSLYRFCEFTYYAATRPMSETLKLKVKHVLFDRKLLFVPAEISKNKKDDYIPMSDGLVSLLLEMKVNEANPEDYLFGLNGMPAPKPASPNYFGKPFTKIRDELGIDKNISIYSWKHTRALDLAKANASPYDIMKLFRHSSLEITMNYMRDLGIDLGNEINERTRKF